MSNGDRKLTVDVSYKSDKGSLAKVESDVSNLKKHISNAVVDANKASGRRSRVIDVEAAKQKAADKSAHALRIAQEKSLHSLRQSNSAAFIKKLTYKGTGSSSFAGDLKSGMLQRLKESAEVSKAAASAAKAALPLQKSLESLAQSRSNKFIMGIVDKGTGSSSFAGDLRSSMLQRLKESAEDSKEAKRRRRAVEADYKASVKAKERLHKEALRAGALRERESRKAQVTSEREHQHKLHEARMSVQRRLGTSPYSSIGQIAAGGVLANYIVAGINSVAGGVGGFLADIPRQAMSMEGVRTGHGVMLGSDAAASSMLKELQTLSANTPLRFKDVQEAGRQMLQYNVPADKLVNTLRMIGDVTGGDSDRFGRMVYAYSQMSTIGKLAGTELRQMTEAGFNPLDVLTQNAIKAGDNRSRDEIYGDLVKKMSAGELNKGMIEDAFNTATSAGGTFYRYMERMAKTASGMMSTLLDYIDMFKQAVGEQFLDRLKLVIDRFTAFVRGPLGVIGTNIANNIMPVVDTLIAGLELVLEKTFGLKSIIKNLQDPKKASAFFESMRLKIIELLPVLQRFLEAFENMGVFLKDTLLPLMLFAAEHIDTIFKGFIVLKVLSFASAVLQLAKAFGILAGSSTLAKKAISLVGGGLAAGAASSAAGSAIGGAAAGAGGAAAATGAKKFLPSARVWLTRQVASAPVQMKVAAGAALAGLTAYMALSGDDDEENGGEWSGSSGRYRTKSVIDPVTGVVSQKVSRIDPNESEFEKELADKIAENSAAISNLLSTLDSNTKELQKNSASHDTNSKAVDKFSLSASMRNMAARALNDGAASLTLQGI